MLNYFFIPSSSGRKVGHLIDLGGSFSAAEIPERAAQREFLEEGGKYLFSADQFRQYFAASQTWTQFKVHRRKRNWTLYFVRVPHVDLAPANQAHMSANGKRREFFWIPKKTLLEALARSPETPPPDPRAALPGHAPLFVWKRLAKMKKKIKKLLRELQSYSQAVASFEKRSASSDHAEGAENNSESH